MSKSANGNVVAIGDHPRARARLSPQESASVMTDCRELALDRISRSLAGMLDRVEDDLFELAEKASDRDAQNVYLDARAQARSKRPAIESTFRMHFVDFFNRKVRGEATHAPDGKSTGEMSLVNDEDLEQSIAVSEMARKMHSTCESELYALSQRFGFLLERPELADDANPLSPATIFEALKDACDQIEAGYKVRLTLLRMFENHVAADLERVYHDLNSHLVQRQILPEIRPSIRRSTSAPGAERRSQAPAAGSGAPAAGAAGGPAPEDVFRTLAQFLGMAGSGSAGGGSGGGAFGGPAAGGMALAAGAPAPNGGSGTFSFPGGGAPPAQGFVQALTRMHQGAPAAGEGAQGNVLRELRSAPQSASLAPLDAMTIDIVAMLFDYIFDDRQIPARVKAVLGRLQIPTLKVALLDKAFFSSKAHPARRLLDRLASASIGLDETTTRGAATLAEIEDVVSRVLNEFDTDIALFDSLTADVEAFLAEQERAHEAIVETTSRWVEAREREEIARLTAEDEVERRVAAHAYVPGPVRTMLAGPWCVALASAQLRDGENGPGWKSLVSTMDDLLWSVEPKPAAEDRRRLVGMLPAMLRSLHDGLDREQTTQAERDAFFGALVDCHAAAVKAGLKGIAMLDPAPHPEPEPVELPSVERSMVPAGDIQVEEIRLKTPRGKGPVRNVFTRSGIWTNLPRGTWVEFSREGSAIVHGRLTWISPAKGVYLFTNALASAGAISISPEALAEQMRRGEARIMDGAPLVDRAVDSMLAHLRERAA